MFGMKKPILFLFLGLAAICAAADKESDGITTVKIEPEPPISPSTPKPPTTKPTKPAPPTTKPTTPPTTTTPTTENPPTTHPTTTAPTTTPTTAAPITTPTTTAPITTPTTAAPVTTPKPAFEAGTWEVLNKNKTACILLHMKGAVDVYHKNQTNVDQIQIPKSAVAYGNCSVPLQNIVLSWPFNSTLNETVEIVFKKNDTKFDLEMVKINVIVTNKNSTEWLNVNRTKEEFETPVTMSYKCKKTQMLNFTDLATNETVASLMISDVQFQAFGEIKDRSFASAKDCEPYETPDIVPIAVGCALIALIVFVLIGYLIGRRRNQTRGYLSMFTQTKKEEDYIPMKNLSCFQ